MTRIFHWLFMWKMDPTWGFDIRLVFTLPPSDSTLKYKRCVYLWNNFPCIKSLILLVKLMWISKGSLKIIWFMTSLVNRFWSFLKEFNKTSKIVLCYDRCNTFVFGPFFAYIFCQDQNLTLLGKNDFEIE